MNAHVATELELEVRQAAFRVGSPKCANTINEEAVSGYGRLETLLAVPWIGLTMHISKTLQ
jgi:hypothetical protein